MNFTHFHKVYLPESYFLTPMPGVKDYITLLLAILPVDNSKYDKKDLQVQIEEN